MTLGIDFEDTVMADIDCAKCGEPWDAYGVRQAELHGQGDMTLGEAKRFCRGEGCPCCGFGSRCPSCAGGGRDLRYAYGPRRCRLCSDTGRVLARVLVRDLPPTTSAATALRVERPAGIWTTGYGAAARRICGPRAFKGLPGELHQSADGPFLERYLRCPEGCWDDLPECSACGGDGALHVDDPEALAERAARQDMAAWDGDPYVILEKRGLLD